MKLDGATLFLREEVWPALVVPDGVDRDMARLAACHQLEAMGHWRAVNFNTQSLRALVKELDSGDSAGTLTGPLGDFVRAEKRTRVVVNNAKRSKGYRAMSEREQLEAAIGGDGD